MIYPPFDHPVWLVPAFLIGACIGSFLNVVIYRLPLGLSVNDPKRSFCPKCKSPIPLRRNVPVISWLLLRGRCGDCKAPISPRYVIVELLTAFLFAAVFWWVIQRTGGKSFAPGQLAILPLWYMIASFVALSFIDAEHMIIPLVLTITGTIAGLVAAVLLPEVPDLIAWSSLEPAWLGGLWQSVLGGVIGFFGLWGVVLLGKLAFGRKEIHCEEAAEWRLEEPQNDEDPIHFHMGDEKLAWWDIFYRSSDRLVIEADSLVVDGTPAEPGKLTIREQEIELPDGSRVALEDLVSLEGTARHAVIPREAMGMGDVHLMGMIGALFGWAGVFFTLLASSLYALAGAALGRIGFGMRLPYGPFLVLGALTWMFGGWKLAEWYVENLGLR